MDTSRDSLTVGGWSRQARALLELLGQSAGEAWLALSATGAPLWHSARFEDWFGEPERAAAAEPLSGVVARACREPAECSGSWLAGGRSIDWACWPMALEDPEPRAGVGRLLRFRDGSERLHAERVRQELEGRLRLLSAHTEGIIFELDAQARFVRAWASDPALLARPESEILGRTLIETLGPEIGGWHDEKVRRILETGVSENYEYTMDVPSGRRSFAASNVVVPSLERDERSVIYWIRDITDQVQLRLKLLQAERLASLGLLAAGVAHEINNPLGYMLLNIGQLQKGLLRLDGQAPGDVLSDLRTAAEILEQGAERVRKIVDELRNFSRPDDTLGPVDVHRALCFSLDMLRAELSRRARVVRDFGEVPPVLANENRLGQVFINLLTNAAQAITSGEIAENEIRVVTRTDTAGRACIEIRDTGEGVHDTVRERIFDPFFTTKRTGTGLGLPISQSIVSALGGEIALEPQAPRGTIFRVLLPTGASA